MTPLETLYAARHGLLTGAYEHGNWNSCGCGHIYRAATGQIGNTATVALSPQGVYVDALELVAEANGIDPNDSEYVVTGFHALPVLVSAAIERLAMRASQTAGLGQLVDERPAAIALIEKAIGYEERRQEEARLDVVAQARAVVDAVPPAQREAVLA